MNFSVIAFKAASALCRAVHKITAAWKYILIALFFAFETGPHIRAPDVVAQQYGGCVYLGSRGLIRGEFYPQCPLFIYVTNPHSHYRL